MFKILRVLFWVMTLGVIWVPLVYFSVHPDFFHYGWNLGFLMSCIGSLGVARDDAYMGCIYRFEV